MAAWPRPTHYAACDGAYYVSARIGGRRLWAVVRRAGPCGQAEWQPTAPPACPGARIARAQVPEELRSVAARAVAGLVYAVGAGRL